MINAVNAKEGQISICEVIGINVYLKIRSWIGSGQFVRVVPTTKFSVPTVCIIITPYIVEMNNPKKLLAVSFWAAFPVIHAAGMNPIRYPNSGVSK